MARGVNKVILIGNLGKDPDHKTFPNGGAVTNVSLATSESWKGRDGQMQEHTEWHNLVFNDKLADIAKQYLRKGSKIYVEGQIRTRKYQDKEGKDRFITEIRVRDMQMLDGKPGGGEAGFGGGGGASYERGSAPARASSPAPAESGGGGFEDDDIPF
ncbi:MAG TPA: single-stranded DNA-binding protein [Nevskiaceae bacterium]|nr:single-stranded DNA-binding protein [Nevskiaceae bacterium]